LLPPPPEESIGAPIFETQARGRRGSRDYPFSKQIESERKKSKRATDEFEGQ